MEKNNQGQAGRNNALCVPEISQEMHSVQFQISKGPLFLPLLGAQKIQLNKLFTRM